MTDKNGMDLAKGVIIQLSTFEQVTDSHYMITYPDIFHTGADFLLKVDRRNNLGADLSYSVVITYILGTKCLGSDFIPMGIIFPFIFLYRRKNIIEVRIQHEQMSVLTTYLHVFTF